LVERIATLLGYLDAAKVIDDIDIPSLRLHSLKGEFKGYWAITVRANWRIIPASRAWARMGSLRSSGDPSRAFAPTTPVETTCLAITVASLLPRFAHSEGFGRC
jgi:hypothetical protein